MYARDGRKSEAIAVLEKYYAQHSSVVLRLKVDPGFDPLRSDPHFQAFLRRVGLADSGAAGQSPAKP